MASKGISGNKENIQVTYFTCSGACIALAAVAIAGLALVVLGSLEMMFGSLREIGFIASTAGGGTLFLVSVGGIVCIEKCNLKAREQPSMTVTTPMTENKSSKDVIPPTKMEDPIKA